jgi:hypothetical protein
LGNRAKTNPVQPISSATLFSKIMIANAGRNAVNSSNQFWAQSAQRREAIQDHDGDQQDQQRSEQADQIPAQRHPPPEAALSEVTKAVTINAGTADPRTFSSTPCGIAPPGRNPGSVGPLGTKTRAVVVAYTSTKTVAIGCLTIHDLNGEISVRAACSVCPAMIGTSS